MVLDDFAYNEKLIKFYGIYGRNEEDVWRLKTIQKIVCVMRVDVFENVFQNYMFKVIRASFAQRRKTLVNGLCNSSEISVDKEAVLNALEEMGLKADVRGEKLSLAEFAKLSDLLCS